ncbi:guanine deaminase [Holophaga foetida]|uniref:guanine deaminase n=1 Tax=Holophaga foetida TaxID=35839 RepID=UPI0002473364|nr:guanine deaminase [Holophaga foetida]
MGRITGSCAYRARVLHLVADPAVAGDSAAQYFDDGVLWVENGVVRAVGPAESLLPLGAGVAVHEFPNHLILPGFVDTHLHYPQTEMIASYGEQLLNWLETYTFPTETRFRDADHARRIAELFLKELLRNGTTTALVFCTVHPQSVDAFFEAAKALGLCMIAGKVLMDRNAPTDLLDTAESGYEQSRLLLERWHGVDRLRYAVTPRFAPTSTPEQMSLAARLLREYPGVYLQTHLAENLGEVEWVRELFPAARHYLDVYDQFGLLGERSVFAHGIHLCEDEYQRLAQSGSSVAHCATSNLFLGSGLIDLDRLRAHDVRVGLGTDVGAGTSFSMFRTMDEAYKIQQLRGSRLDPLQALHLATLGGAEALRLGERIGNLQPGKDADFSILDLEATPLLAFRLKQCRSVRELLFVLSTLGDDRLVQATYALGRCVHNR